MKILLLAAIFVASLSPPTVRQIDEYARCKLTHQLFATIIQLLIRAAAKGILTLK